MKFENVLENEFLLIGIHRDLLYQIRRDKNKWRLDAFLQPSYSESYSEFFYSWKRLLLFFKEIPSNLDDFTNYALRIEKQGVKIEEFPLTIVLKRLLQSYFRLISSKESYYELQLLQLEVGKKLYKENGLREFYIEILRLVNARIEYLVNKKEATK